MVVDPREPTKPRTMVRSSITRATVKVVTSRVAVMASQRVKGISSGPRAPVSSA